MIIRTHCTEKRETLGGRYATLHTINDKGGQTGEPFLIRMEDKEEFDEFEVNKRYKLEISLMEKIQ